MIYSFLIASMILTLMPGPDILFVLAVSLERGTKQAVSVALGLCSGLIFHTTAVVMGVAVIIANSPVLFMVVKYLGAGYLTWLGVKTTVAARERRLRIKVNTASETYATTDKTDTRVSDDMSNWKFYKRGVTMNVLNPKVLLFFLAFLPGFIDPRSDTPAMDTVILGGIFAAQALVIFTLVALLGDLIGHALHLERYMDSMGFAVSSACVYFALAIFIAL